jgi:hypothetical protein
MADRRARVSDVHQLAAGMPHVTVYPGTEDRPVYQVGGKSFVFFRTPRPVDRDPDTGEKYDDVIVFWVDGEQDKQALLQSGPPYFTTAHFNGHPSVLIRQSELGRLSLTELTELVQDAWLSRASKTRARAWLAEHPT